MSTAATDADWGQDGLIHESRRRGFRRFGHRDAWASFLVASSFLVTAVALVATIPTSRSPSPLVYALMIAAYAGTARVQFEFGTGLALPTQLVLVPMLFVLPLPAVPLCVFAGLAVAYVRRDASVNLVLLLLGSSWHAVGPVSVLLLAHGAGARGLRWSDSAIYVSALAAQFVFEFAATSLRDWFGLGISPRTRIRYASWVFLVDAALAPVGLLVAGAAVDHEALVVLVLPLVGLLKLFARERTQRIDHALELSNAYRGTALLLGDVVEADDAYTGSHSRDVVSLTLEVCDRLGLPPHERRDAEFVALLHDVGKIRIPGEIINKPGALTPEERAIIETHTVEGEAMLTKVGGLIGQVGHLVRSCHERWDGKGYPDGLAGEQIPLIARIVCTTDAFSAMTTDRPYRKARPVEDAVEELRRCAGTHFDPQVVDALAACV